VAIVDDNSKLVAKVRITETAADSADSYNMLMCSYDGIERHIAATERMLASIGRPSPSLLRRLLRHRR
jgi:hypothetical protein